MGNTVRTAFVTALTLTLISLRFAPAFAGTTIEISNNEEGARASVDVNVNSNSSSSIESHSSSDVNTDITISTNGETKTYRSNQSGNVSLESSDGKAKVNISTNASGSPSLTVIQEGTQQSVRIIQNNEGVKVTTKSEGKEEDKDFNAKEFLESWLPILKVLKIEISDDLTDSFLTIRINGKTYHFD